MKMKTGKIELTCAVCNKKIGNGDYISVEYCKIELTCAVCNKKIGNGDYISVEYCTNRRPIDGEVVKELAHSKHATFCSEICFFEWVDGIKNEINKQ